MTKPFRLSAYAGLVVAFLLTASLAAANTPPAVSNVQAAQRPGTFLVDITFDLADAENNPAAIALYLSTDAGLTYPLQLVSLTGDIGPGLLPGAGKTVVWDAGADFPEYFGLECSIRVVADDAVPGGVTLVVLLERAGSMAGAFAATVNELGVFYQDPGTGSLTVGMNYFPVGGVPNECLSSLYDPLQVPAVAIPAGAANLVYSMSVQAAAGSAPTNPALAGSLAFATAFKDANPNETVAVVLITDGAPTACATQNSELVFLAQSGFLYNGTLTYVIALPGAIVTDLNAIAAAGGTGAAHDVTSNILQLSEKMVLIAADAASR